MTDRWYSLERKTIWVTGGAGYFGAAVIGALDTLCEKVICVDLADRAETLLRQQSLQRTIPLSRDLTDTAALPAWIDELIGVHGLPDGLVHLSYASNGAGRALADLSADTFRATLIANLEPLFVLTRNLAERMKPRRSGSFVLFSSMYGVVSPDPRIYEEPMKPNPIDYGASKAAVLQMTRYFAVHYGPFAIRFNCVTPGPFPHPSLQSSDPAFIRRLAQKTPLGRIGQAPDIIGPALFLLTDGAAYMTGQNLLVDGGWTAW